MAKRLVFPLTQFKLLLSEIEWYEKGQIDQ
jgi:hypothetical protein